MTYGTNPKAELFMTNTLVIDVVSSVNGRSFRLNVGLPAAPPPRTGYRVLYVLDGNTYAASAIDAVRGGMNAADVIIVGIGYPETEAFISASLERNGPPTHDWHTDLPPFVLAIMRERVFDLTLPTGRDWPVGLALVGLPESPSAYGGLNEFLETIDRDIKPFIAGFGPIDNEGTALFGYSAGGHAALHALFTRPGLVKTFVAASSAIWLSDRAVLLNEGRFATLVESGEATPRVLVTMGSEESSPPRGLPPEFAAEHAQALFARANMVEESRQLVARLQALRGHPGYEIADYAVFAGQQHGISAWPALGRAIDFAFQR